MEYVEVPYTEYIRETLAALPEPGLLLVTAGKNGKPNAMTIGWATIGMIWRRPIFIVMVRPSRFTYQLLSESNTFTVCVAPAGSRFALDFCGTYSGRDQDKFTKCELSLSPSSHIPTPGIAGWPVIYECQTAHTNHVIPDNLIPGIQSQFYSRDDYHRIHFGEILAVRALRNATALLHR